MFDCVTRCLTNLFCCTCGNDKTPVHPGGASKPEGDSPTSRDGVITGVAKEAFPRRPLPPPATKQFMAMVNEEELPQKARHSIVGYHIKKHHAESRHGRSTASCPHLLPPMLRYEASPIHRGPQREEKVFSFPSLPSEGEYSKSTIIRVLIENYPRLEKEYAQLLSTIKTKLHDLPSSFSETGVKACLKKTMRLIENLETAILVIQRNSGTVSLERQQELIALNEEVAPFFHLLNNLTYAQQTLEHLKNFVATTQASLQTPGIPMRPHRVSMPQDLRALLQETLQGAPFEVATKPVGAGGFGTVVPVQVGPTSLVEKSIHTKDKEGVPLDESQIQRRIFGAFCEIAILLSLPPHPNLCGIVHTHAEGTGAKIYFKRAEEDLSDWIKEHTVAEFINLLPQILAGFRTLHTIKFSLGEDEFGEGVVHNDFKLENVLIFRNDDGTVTAKIADFGLAGFQGASGRGFTIYYAAPEQIQKAPVTTASDIWALGITCTAILTNKFPFSKDYVKSPRFRDQTEINNSLKALFASCSDIEAKDPDGTFRTFIQRCLQVDATKRPTANELLRDPLLTTPSIAYEYSSPSEAPDREDASLRQVSSKDVLYSLPTSAGNGTLTGVHPIPPMGGSPVLRRIRSAAAVFDMQRKNNMDRLVELWTISLLN